MPNTRRQAALDYAVYLAVRLGVCVLQAISLQSCHALARFLAWLLGDVFRVRRSVLDDNLKHAYPAWTDAQRKELAWRMWEHLFLLVAEVAQAPRKIHQTNWRDYVELRNRRALVSALLDDRPLVIVAAHYGNFELCGYILGLLGFASYSIARPLDNPYLNRFVAEFRGSTGQHILPKNGSAKQIDALLQAGGTLALLGDQHAGPKACWVQFFGRPASTHKAIALFSLGEDAPLAVCYSRRIGGPLHHAIGVEAIADPRTLTDDARSVPALTQWFTSVIERIIRESPDQYWWIHRRWKDTRVKRVVRAAGEGSDAHAA